jgi:arylformamidase
MLIAMKFYDVTVAVSADVPIYEGDPLVTIESVKRIAHGDNANVSNLCFGAHTGTHIDAPNHFIEGSRRIEDLDVEKLIGPCRVIELDESAVSVTPADIAGLDGVERVIFKTRNSSFWDEPEKGFRTDFTYIEPDAARILADRGMKLVGIDYLSVEKFGSDDFATHITLLEKEVVILEGLDLRQVPAGDYELISLPLKYVGGTGDGAPARTILVDRG